jgi:hypothetical protein
LSSILKALKRIEGRSPPPQSFPALPDSVDAKQAVNSNARKRWLLRRFITVSLVLLVIVVTAFIIFQQRQFVISKIFPAGSPVAKQQKSKAAEEKSKIFRAKIPPATVKQAPKKPEPTRSARQQIKTVALGQKTKKAKTYAKLNDSKIKLQALAWSSDAAKRMAVINGRIVREVESVDGYQINQIRQEDVVVSDGRQSWSLEFGLKQEPAAADVTVSVPQRPKKSVHSEIGDIIKEDQLLLIIDHEPFKAAVENARDGAVKQKAQLERAEIDYNRNLALLNHAHEFIYDDSDAAPLPPVDYGQQ